VVTERPTIFCLHGLGLSGRMFEPVAARLAGVLDVVAIDLPGFGDEPPVTGSLLDASVALVEDRIRKAAPSDYLIAGHSMGGKVATLVTARALEARSGLAAPAGVVLLAASPPAPEPMQEPKRLEMLGWADGPAIPPAAARSFVDDNVAGPMAAEADRIAITDVERSAPAAWRSWLTEGSLQDDATGLAPISVPAVIAAGAEDGALGVDAQRRLNLPHYLDGDVVVVDGAAHFLPLEQPDTVAELVSGLLPLVRRPGS
jgi:pimeloyl-ACP methyl ester carboxylesterase